jgi:hypothetical protein
MMRKPLSSNAVSIASKTGYFVVRVFTQSRSRYRPSKNATIAPAVAPINTAIVAISTPTPNPNTLANIKPLPRVRIDPGINNTVAMKYTPINAKTPGVGLSCIHCRNISIPCFTY